MKITLIGNSTVDVLARPVNADVFASGSQPAEEIRMSCGGDGLNEAVMLSRMGKQTELISKIGTDDAGSRILSFLQDNHVSTDHMIIEEAAETSLNLVLIDDHGQRSFITNPKGSQRTLSYEEIVPHIKEAGEIVSFASIFVSSAMMMSDYQKLFSALKKEGRVLCADMTKRKRGESLQDLLCFLPGLDYVFPNEEEIALLTGNNDPEINAGMLVDAGVKCAVIKCGEKGCIIKTEDECMHVPAYPHAHCIDTTGAGDTFVAGFLYALSEGMPLYNCGLFANAAASCNIEKTGASEGVTSLDEPMRRFLLMKQ